MLKYNLRLAKYWGKRRPVRILEAQGTDPYLNLATEDYLLNGVGGVPSNMETLFLWRNSPTIVLGRNQNAWKEVNLSQVEKENVLLTRRKTGGGCVYHDLGNTNFTFVSPKAEFNKEKNFSIITKALADCGVKAEFQGRNDVVLEDGRKISGSAYKHGDNFSLHHGTLLVNVDLPALGRLLNPNKLKLQAKGVSSAAARVANLSEVDKSLTHRRLVDALAAQFCSVNQSACELVELDPESLTYVPEVLESLDGLRSRDWIFAVGSPDLSNFTHNIQHRFSWGTVDVDLRVSEGSITAVTISTDCLIPVFIQAIEATLPGTPYTPEGITAALSAAQAAAQQADPSLNLRAMADEFAQLLAQSR
eukprot:gnl/Hemi2/19923_TR6612_c0_g1_i1.p1 gnl/Hemi2/19923_TR6612_c0_g1~~gnl/Hemi2/19923_TR6612_c0_g1_i1.p1  ORF type:complete len:362 (+),score=71.15 gnl/Hemi2/19923_TR6612_c0_g1_i1:65-1150(+)